MSAPINPTLASIVAEGLRQAGELNPSTSMTATYQNEVMEQLKNEVWKMCREPKIMQTFSYGVCVIGQNRYSNPSDFSGDLKIVILDGNNGGTAQGGSQTTLILQAGQNLGLGDVQGKEIVITGGTGQGSGSQIISIANNSGTLTVTVTPGFPVAPDSASTYLIIDQQWPVVGDHLASYLEYRSAQLTRPKKFYPMGDEDFGEFIFDYPPDKAYPMRMHYYVNIMTTDLSSTLMLRLYLEWRNFWIQGIKAKHLAYNDDARADSEWTKWKNELQELIISAQYGTNLHEFAQRVTDY